MPIFIETIEQYINALINNIQNKDAPFSFRPNADLPPEIMAWSGATVIDYLPGQKFVLKVLDDNLPDNNENPLKLADYGKSLDDPANASAKTSANAIDSRLTKYLSELGLQHLKIRSPFSDTVRSCNNYVAERVEEVRDKFFREPTITEMYGDVEVTEPRDQQERRTGIYGIANFIAVASYLKKHQASIFDLLKAFSNSRGANLFLDYNDQLSYIPSINGLSTTTLAEIDSAIEPYLAARTYALYYAEELFHFIDFSLRPELASASSGLTGMHSKNSGLFRKLCEADKATGIINDAAFAQLLHIEPRYTYNTHPEEVFAKYCSRCIIREGSTPEDAGDVFDKSLIYQYYQIMVKLDMQLLSLPHKKGEMEETYYQRIQRCREILRDKLDNLATKVPTDVPSEAAQQKVFNDNLISDMRTAAQEIRDQIQRETGVKLSGRSK